MKQLTITLALILTFTPIFAQTILVVNDETGTNNAESPFATIAAALEVAQTGDIIEITGGGDKTHTELGIDVTKGVTFKGEGQNTTIVQAHAQRGEASNRIFYVKTTSPVNFQDMTLQHGNVVSKRGGAVDMYSSEAQVNFERVTLKNNDSTWGGGAISLSRNGVLRVTDCKLEDNDAGIAGGAILNNRGTVIANDCLFLNNTSGSRGGAIGSYFTANAMDINSCTFTGNSGHYGGAIGFRGGDSFSITNCTIYDNTALYQGGAIYDGGSSNIVNISSCTIVDNTASSLGGGIYFYDYSGKSNLKNTIVANNTDVDGANDVYFYYGTLNTNESNLVENCTSSTNGTCPTFFSTNDPNLDEVASCGKHSYFKPLNSSDALDNAVADVSVPGDICGRIRTAPHDLGSFDVKSKVLPTIAGNVEFCKGQSTELDAGNWASFEWSNGESTSIIEVTNGSLYGVTVTDAYGATGTTEVEVNSFDIFTFDTENAVQTQTSSGMNVYSVEVCGGVFPYSANLESTGGFVSTQFMPSASSGCQMLQITYGSGVDWTATVTDGNGCTSDVSVLLDTTPLLVIDGFGTTNESGAGQNDGTLTVNVSGGDDSCSEYTYDWSGYNLTVSNTDGVVENTLTGLATGSYSVTITDCAGNTVVGNIYLNRASGRGRKTTLDTSIEGVLQLQPNPANDFVRIQYKAEQEGKLVVSVADLAGRTLWREVLNSEEGRFEISLDDFNNGLYIVSLQADNQLIDRKKLLVVK